MTFATQQQFDTYRANLSPAQRLQFDRALADTHSPFEAVPFRLDPTNPTKPIYQLLPAVRGAANLSEPSFSNVLNNDPWKNLPTGLEYTSAAADTRPVVELGLYSGPGDAVPTGIDLTVTINGTPQTTRVFTVGGGYSAGQDFILADQVSSALTASGRYTWSAEAILHFSGSPDQTINASGANAIVVQPAAGATGHGWGFNDLSRLTIDGGGDWIAYTKGSSQHRLYHSGMSGWEAPANDFGALTYDSGISRYIYTAYDGAREEFTTSGLLVKRVDARGLVASFSYDGSQNLVGTIAPNGEVATYSYSSGKLTTIELPGNRLETFTFDGSGRLSSWQQADGSRRTFTYDGSGRLTSEQRGPQTTSYVYDTKGFVTEVNQTGGRTATILPAKMTGMDSTLDAIAQRGVTTIDLPNGGQTTLTYSRYGGLLGKTNPDHSGIQLERDPHGRVSSYADAQGGSYDYAYSGVDDLASISRNDTAFSSFTYSGTVHRVTEHYWIQPRRSFEGWHVTVRNTGFEPIETWRTGSFEITRSGLSDLSNPLTVYYTVSGTATNGADYQTLTGSATIPAYQSSVSTTITPLSDALTEGDETISITLTPDNSYGVDIPDSISITLRDFGWFGPPQNTNSGETFSETVGTTFDGDGHVTSYTGPNLTEYQFTWSGGVLQTMQDPLGRVVTFSYSGSKRVENVTYASGAKLTFGYDAAGRLNSVRDLLDRRTTLLYDPVGRLTGLHEPGRMAETITYDIGEVSQWQRSDGTTLNYTFNRSTGQLETALAATGGGGDTLRTTTTLDTSGRISSTLDYQQRRTTWLYDSMDRLTAIINQLNQRTTYQYDARGELQTHIDALNQRTTYVRDLFGRATRVTVPDGTSTDFVYNGAGQPSVVKTALGQTTQFDYTTLNQLEKTTNALGQTRHYRYDAVGGLRSLTDEASRVYTYTRDSLDRLESTVDPANRTTHYVWNGPQWQAMLDPANRAMTYALDQADRVVGIQDPSGAWVTFQYDSRGNQEATVNALGYRVTTLFDSLNRRTGTLDALNQRMTITWDGMLVSSVTNARNKTTNFHYDGLGRLEAMVDALGHRTTQSYDANGNIQALIDALGNRTTFTHDARDRHIGTLDALGNRTTTVYDADSNVLAQMDALGNRTSFTYDGLNRMLAVLDALGNRTTQVYDVSGNVVATIDALGNITTSLYDTLNRLEGTIDALGNRTTRVYDTVGDLVAMVDALNRRTTWNYDSNHRLEATIDALNQRTTTVYDAGGQAIAQIDALGNRTTSIFDAVGQRIAQVDALGNRTTWTYSNGQLQSVQDALGNRTTYLLDDVGRVESVLNALNQRTTTVYDAVGNAIAHVDALNRRTTTLFDALNRAYATQDALGHRTTTVFDAAGNAQAMLDALNNRTTFQYDALGRQTTIRNALNQVQTLIYDAVGNRTGMINAAGERTTTLFDALNRSVASINALGHRTTSTYDVVGNVMAMTNPLNQTHTFGYDALDRRVETLDPLGNRTTMVFDAAGNSVASINALGQRTTTVFDVLNRAYAVQNALDQRTTTVFDAVGNAITQIDALGYRTTSTFDALNRRVAQMKPLGGVTTWSYDAVSQLLAMTDALNHTTTFGYDAAGQRVTVTDALNFTTTSVFDARGNRTALVDASGNRTTWVYDTLARVAQEISPNNGTTSYTYDAAGRTADVTDALGRKKAYGYDAAGRNITVAWYSAVPSLIQTNTFTFDDANRMVGAANNQGTYTFTLDAVGRVNEVAEPFGLSLTFAYDAVGNRTRVQDSKGGLTTSTFDAGNQLTRREFTGQGTELRIDYAYTGRGQIYNELRLADLAGTQRVGDTIYAHDEEGRVYDLKHRGAIITDIVQHDSFAYDLANRLTSRTLDGVTTSFVYDATNQLIKDGATPTITYDATGNRTNSGYATTTGNRITNDGTWTFTYDAVGNITKKSKGASDETWTYAYDHNNQMTAASKYATDGGTLLGSVEYAFDVFGNRLSRIQKDGSGTPTSTERFGYDGWDTAKPGAIGTENFDTWADLDGSNALVNRRIFDAGFDHLSAKISSAGSTNWYLGDLQGSVTHLTNAAGTIIGTLTYDAFGNTTSQSGTTDRYTYTAREWDTFANLQYNRARMYDPAIGRWYSTDPIGFEAGDANLYRYVGNGYVNATDPSGFWGINDLLGGAGAIIAPVFGPVANKIGPILLQLPAAVAAPVQVPPFPPQIVAGAQQIVEQDYYKAVGNLYYEYRSDPVRRSIMDIGQYLWAATRSRVIHQVPTQILASASFGLLGKSPASLPEFMSIMVAKNAERFAKDTNNPILSQKGLFQGTARHLIWQALITFMYGIRNAQAIGDSHESLELTKDSFVDLANNVVGREIGMRAIKHFSNKYNLRANISVDTEYVQAMDYTGNSSVEDLIQNGVAPISILHHSPNLQTIDSTKALHYAGDANAIFVQSPATTWLNATDTISIKRLVPLYMGGGQYMPSNPNDLFCELLEFVASESFDAIVNNTAISSYDDPRLPKRANFYPKSVDDRRR